MAELERSDRIVRGADDRFLVHIEAGVDDGWSSRQPVVVVEDTMKCGVDVLADQLRTRRTVDVDCRRTRLFHEGGAVERERHELGSVLAALDMVVAGLSMLVER